MWSKRASLERSSNIITSYTQKHMLENRMAHGTSGRQWRMKDLAEQKVRAVEEASEKKKKSISQYGPGIPEPKVEKQPAKF